MFSSARIPPGLSGLSRESSGPDSTASFRTEKTGKARKTILRNFRGKITVYIPDITGREKRGEKRGKIRNLFYGKKREKFPGFFRKPFPFSSRRTRALRPSCRVFFPPAMLRTQDADSSGHARLLTFPAGTNAPCRRRLSMDAVCQENPHRTDAHLMGNSRRNRRPVPGGFLEGVVDR